MLLVIPLLVVVDLGALDVLALGIATLAHAVPEQSDVIDGTHPMCLHSSGDPESKSCTLRTHTRQRRLYHTAASSDTGIISGVGVDMGLLSLS